ncbi:hypothetical protein FRB95_008732 [Tulasnella sp. JGI-2019a]|nr:hypothetical protein FRB95_008732 [Tulasnella sp. JGI-2019a]
MPQYVETCLYSHISTDDTRVIKLLGTLHTQPELAHNIVAFDGRLYPAQDRHHFSSRVPTPILKHWHQEHSIKRYERKITKSTATLIHHMMNAKSLELQDLPWLEIRIEESICNLICSTASLRSLTSLAIQCLEMSSRDLNKRRDYSRHLCLILRGHPLLERLELLPGLWDLGPWILQSHIPRLSHLAANSDTARVMIRGRPNTSLYIPNLMDVRDADTWEALAASTAPINSDVHVQPHP